jgi:hypothetical protein
VNAREVETRVRTLGARRKELRAQLASVDGELKALMPDARSVAQMSQEAIRDACALGVPTIRLWTQGA